MATKRKLDVRVYGGGTVYTLTAETSAAKDWIAANVDAPDFAWLGKSLAVEARYVGPLVDGMVRDGLVVGN